MTHDNVTDIVGRLRKVEGSSPDRIGISTNWYRNPEGPEAADIIEAQQADLATLRKQLENAREALRQCRNAVKGGKDEPRRNVREIVDEALGQKTTLGGELANQYIEDQQP